MKALEGLSAIVSGGGQGLGAAITEHYVAAGASVMICGRALASLEATKAKLEPRLVNRQRLEIAVADVAVPKEVDAFISETLKRLGRIDILVNNAGVYGPIGRIDEVDWNEWVDAISINLMGTVYPSRAVLPHFLERGRGKIINISGGGATNPLPGISAYAASKAAVVRLTETMALEVRGRGIEINAIAPGLLATRLTDQLLAAGPGRVGQAFYDRILKTMKEGSSTPLAVPAKLCVWLASGASDGVTGKLIAAVWDPYENFPQHLAELNGTDIYTLRRIVPKDRGMGWGNDP
jgi:NAD(P)-dependent dehydrogenase (short-subunit alcohol dehydrogenase family)